MICEFFLKPLAAMNSALPLKRMAYRKIMHSSDGVFTEETFTNFSAGLLETNV